MRHSGRLLEMLDRAEQGPMIEEKEFEGGLVAGTAKKLVEKYGIKFDREQVVPQDDEMADRLFQAGMEFAVEVGMFCTNTSRRITWTQKEYEDAIRSGPTEVILGEGVDAVIARSRRPEDRVPPVVLGGPYGVEIPEDMFVPLMVSYAQESVIDVIDNPTLERVYGRPAKAASPWEVVGGWREAELSFEVVGRVGRPGMCIAGVELSPTAFGEISASSWGGFRPSDLHHVAGVSEFKTNYESLAKLAHINRIGGAVYAFMSCIYGGYFGGAEGVAVGLAADAIVLHQNYMPSISSLTSVHPFLQCTTTPEILWAFAVASQAVTRNTNLLVSSLVRPSAGPGTKTMLRELAAHTIATISSGQSFVQASMTATGTHPRHASGLDAKFAGEVGHAALGMSREQANDIVIRLLESFEGDLEKRLIGKPFEEVYDLQTVQPTAEWLGTYAEVADELIGMGLPLDALN
jgi:methylamine---corrinoid protein Co-methyltransferase